MKFICILSAFLIFICFAGCNFDSSNTNSKSKLLLLNENLAGNNGTKIETYDIQQVTALTYTNEEVIECARVTVSWKIESNYDYILFEELNSNYRKYINSPINQITFYCNFSKPLVLKFTSVTRRIQGEPIIINYTAEKSKSKNSSGQALADGIQEIDCTLNTGDYKVVPLENRTVKLLNAIDTNVFVARVNATDRILSSGRGVLALSGCKASDSSRTIKTENSEASGISYDLQEPEIVHADIHIDKNSIIYPSEDSRNNGTQQNYPVNFELGDTRTVYAAMVNTDIDHNMIETTASLQYKSNTCYVWVVEDYFTESRILRGAKINRKICETIGKTLDEVIELERNIFGNEYDAIYKSDSLLPIEENSETGKMINILLYDIANDYEEGNMSGYYGFFSIGDYYTKGTIYNDGAKSNGGKYLHMDSGFASNAKTRNYIYNTLVHEFQHMLFCGQKKFLERNSWNNLSTFFNEMCSSLAEDIFQEKLKLADMESGKLRFRKLALSWLKLSMFKWDNSNIQNMQNAYSNAWGLGSLISKKYGGADFVYDFLHEEGYDLNAFLKTINKYEPSATKESILRDFAVELCTGKTYNSNVYSEKHIMNGYNYPMTKFDFINYEQTVDGTRYKGPYYTALFGDINSFQPDIIDVSKISEVKSETEELRFFGNSENGIKEYLVIVKK